MYNSHFQVKGVIRQIKRLPVGHTDVFVCHSCAVYQMNSQGVIRLLKYTNPDVLHLELNSLGIVHAVAFIAIQETNFK